MKVLTVVGARPQFIKAAPVSRALGADHEEAVVHTGQHYDESLSDVFFDEFGIPEPDYNLGVGSDTQARQTGRMLTELDEVHQTVDPDAVLVYGDTNSTLAAAILGAKADAVLAHVEAGMRSNRWEMPEEVNRVLTDHAADLNLAPSERAVANLAAEGIVDGVVETGDVLFDALRWTGERAADLSTILTDLELTRGHYVLSTIHRPRNTDDRARLERLLTTLDDHPEPVILPIHPRTSERMDEAGLGPDRFEGVRFIEPVGYVDFVQLLSNARVAATDSGSIQKEALYVETPCVTLREETEWVETVEAGWNVLAGADREAILRALDREWDHESPPTPYGTGDAATAIVDALVAAVE